MLLCSVVYLWTRLESYASMKRASAGLQDSVEYLEALQIFLIGHSIVCMLISFLAYSTVRKHTMIDRRQYYVLLGVSTFAILAYIIALTYAVGHGTSSMTRSAYSDYAILNFLENLIDLLESISRNAFSFFFAVIMNFVLVFALIGINLFSMHLGEIAKALEQRRTGGRDTNEVELGGMLTTKT